MFIFATNGRVLSSNQITAIIVRVVPMVIVLRDDTREDIVAVRIICNSVCSFYLHGLVLGEHRSERKF